MTSGRSLRLRPRRCCASRRSRRRRPRSRPRSRPRRRARKAGTSHKGQTANFQEAPMTESALAPAESPPDFVAPVLLPKSRLDRLVQEVSRAYRRAHVTADEARYVHKRVRRLLGLRGHPERSKRLPEILSPDEFRRILAQAYKDRGSYGLIVRTLFETGLRVSELVGVEAGDVDFTERTVRVRQGKGGKDRLVLFTEDL